MKQSYLIALLLIVFLLATYLFFSNDAKVLVVAVRDGFPAEQAGIQAGDYLIEVNGERVADSRRATEAIQNADQLNIQVRRGNELLDFSLEKREDGSTGLALQDNSRWIQFRQKLPMTFFLSMPQLESSP